MLGVECLVVLSMLGVLVFLLGALGFKGLGAILGCLLGMGGSEGVGVAELGANWSCCRGRLREPELL